MHGLGPAPSPPLFDLYLKLQQRSRRAAAIGMAGVIEEMAERWGHDGIRRRD